MTAKLITRVDVAFTVGLALGTTALASEWTLDEVQLVEQSAEYSPFVDQHFPQEVLGDTHHHSALPSTAA